MLQSSCSDEEVVALFGTEGEVYGIEVEGEYVLVQLFGVEARLVEISSVYVDSKFDVVTT